MKRQKTKKELVVEKRLYRHISTYRQYCRYLAGTLFFFCNRHENEQFITSRFMRAVNQTKRTALRGRKLMEKMEVAK